MSKKMAMVCMLVGGFLFWWIARRLFEQGGADVMAWTLVVAGFVSIVGELEYISSSEDSEDSGHRYYVIVRDAGTPCVPGVWNNVMPNGRREWDACDVRLVDAENPSLAVAAVLRQYEVPVGYGLVSELNIVHRAWLEVREIFK